MITAADLLDVATQANAEAQAAVNVGPYLEFILTECATRAKQGLFGTSVTEQEILKTCEPHNDKKLNRHEIDELVFKLRERGFHIQTTCRDARSTFHVDWSAKKPIAQMNVAELCPAHAPVPPAIYVVGSETFKQVLWSLGFAKNLGDVADAIAPLLRVAGVAPCPLQALSAVLREKNLLPEDTRRTTTDESSDHQ